LVAEASLGFSVFTSVVKRKGRTMATQSLKKKKPAGVPDLVDDLTTAGMKVLIRKLIEQATNNNSPSVTNGAGNEEDELILDLEVDGIRCLLLRTHPKLVSAAVTLSPREHEIARMIAKGYPNKTIAAVLDISSWTVCTHIRRIFVKLGVGSRAAMVAKLLEDGSLTASGANTEQSSFKHTS
jgi:DNA-binding CsgD family transcriptional regulator